MAEWQDLIYFPYECNGKPGLLPPIAIILQLDKTYISASRLLTSDRMTTKNMMLGRSNSERRMGDLHNFFLEWLRCVSRTYETTSAHNQFSTSQDGSRK